MVDLMKGLKRKIEEAPDKEEKEWLQAVKRSIEKEEWGNLKYQCWVISNEYNNKYNDLLWAIDKEYGDILENLE